MCGIFGIIGNYDAKNVELSLEKMRTRGPDSTRITHFDNGCFAQNRLSIIALSHEYDPPFTINNKHFVFNGELYNFKQIAKEFAIGEIDSDSLTAFSAFEKNEASFLKSAVGMFAFAMYDEDKKRVVLARDKFGKKPLYYTYQNSKFIFASSLDSLALHIKPKFRKSALKSYLSFRAVMAPQTFYEDVYKLQAGSYLVFENGKISIHKYFDPLDENVDSSNLYDKLTLSVQNRLVCDAPLGAFLSGGIDSSTVCALASRELSNQGKKLHTFCIGYDGFDKDDERYYASLSAKKIGSEHTEIIFSKQQFLHEIDNVVMALDEPISDPASLPLNHMCSVIGKHGFKAILSGEGGDEAFLGYDKYSLINSINNAKKLPFSEYLSGYFERHREQNREWEWYRRSFSGEILYRSIGECFTDEQKMLLLNQKVSHLDSQLYLQKMHNHASRLSSSDYSIWMSYVDIHIWLGEVLLQKADKIGMSNSLEIRCPMMDGDFLSSAILLGDKRLGKDAKWILKELVSEIVPQEVLNRPKKGFSYPFNKWLFESGDPEIVLELNKRTQFFHKAPLEFLYKSAKNGKFKQQFWSVYIFSKWYISRFG